MKTMPQKEGIKYTNARLREGLKKLWESKVKQGQYVISIDKQLISEEDTFVRLWRGDLKAETENKLIASQDQVLQIKYNGTRIFANRKT